MGSMDLPPISEPAGSPEPPSAAPKPCRKLLVLSVVALCFALAAGGAAGYLWLQLNDLEMRTDRALRSIDSNVGSVESDVDSLDGRVDPLESDVGSLDDRVDALESDVGYVTGFDSLSDRIDGLLSALAAAERDIDWLESDSGWRSIDDDIFDAVSSLRECVNDYMVTVGNAGGGRYRYYTC